MGTRTPETGSGFSLADVNPEPASEPDINTPLGKRFLFSPNIMPMACQKRLVSLVTEAATLLSDVRVTGGCPHRRHPDERVSRVTHRKPRVRAVTLPVTLSQSGGLLFHLRGRLGNHTHPIRRPTRLSPECHLPTPP